MSVTAASQPALALRGTLLREASLVSAQSVTLHLPSVLYQRVKRRAEQAARPVEDERLNVVAAAARPKIDTHGYDFGRTVASSRNGPSMTQPPLPFDLNRFVREYAERARGWLLMLRVPPAEAEDIVQNALVILCERWREIQPGLMPAWFRSVVWNLNRTRRRSWAIAEKYRTRVGWAVELDAADANVPAEVRLKDRQVAEVMRRLSDRLPPAQQAVVSLYLFDEMSMEEVAATLGIELVTAYTRWRRARDELRAMVERERARERFTAGVVSFAFLLFLFEECRAWLRRGMAALAALRSARTLRSSSPQENGRGPRHALSVAAVPALVAVTIFATSHTALRSFDPSDIALVEEPIASADVAFESVGLFQSAWAEHEKEATPALPSRVTHTRPLTEANQPAPSAVRAQATVPVPPLLAKAREALLRGNLGETATALRAYEVDHPDPTANEVHKHLRVALALRALDAAKPDR